MSVVIPSYQRPKSLLRCLAAIDKQTRIPDEVIVVCRKTDHESISHMRLWADCDERYLRTLVLVDKPGQIAALRRGMEFVTGDIVAFTDDDTEPKPDWIERLISYYSDPMVGAVGGRDIIRVFDDKPIAEQVGVITWYGKMIGNHHLGCEHVSEVDILKGANASFRRHLVALPEFFKGQGAEVHNEVFLCLSIRRLGYRIIYDPHICVDHFPAVRFDVDQRDESNPIAIRNAAFNVSVTSLLLAPWHKRLAMVLFNIFVGQKGAPGLARLLVGVCRTEHDVLSSFVPAQLGQLDGIIYYFRSKRKLKSSQLELCSLNRTKHLTE